MLRQYERRQIHQPHQTRNKVTQSCLALRPWNSPQCKGLTRPRVPEEFALISAISTGDSLDVLLKCVPRSPVFLNCI